MWINVANSILFYICEIRQSFTAFSNLIWKNWTSKYKAATLIRAAIKQLHPYKLFKSHYMWNYLCTGSDCIFMRPSSKNNKEGHVELFVHSCLTVSLWELSWKNNKERGTWLIDHHTSIVFFNSIISSLALRLSFFQ